ncbi:MAG: hypothetical protein PVF83_06635 [Anaerolineales bacterium]
MTKNTNCWEFMKCGREPGGEHITELGVCPVPLSDEHDGVNRGQNAGRFCWTVAGTLCHGEIQGVFAEKILECINCPFFIKTQDELSYAFIMTEQDRIKS